MIEDVAELLEAVCLFVAKPVWFALKHLGQVTCRLNNGIGVGHCWACDVLVKKLHSITDAPIPCLLSSLRSTGMTCGG